MNRKKLDEMIALVSEHLRSEGFECIEADWLGGERVLRVYIDQIDQSAPVDLDGCARASRRLEDIPELDESINGRFVLEVSSPGIERPLRFRRHFQREIGRTVAVRLTGKHEERWRGQGRLIDVSAAAKEEETTITLVTEEGNWSFPLTSVQRAHVVHDWGGR